MAKWVTLVLTVLVLAGCNTINGMCKDIEQAGEAVQKSSK